MIRLFVSCLIVLVVVSLGASLVFETWEPKPPHLLFYSETALGISSGALLALVAMEVPGE
ncbi:hypothetical protein PDO_1902 [Rhizobium sp. PDO1-076]|uniref:hypothetical protein n=1 Tax=Rhizobium sp. PDO1-076 TaxID=1125979 RepID=UPI00024E35CF|nr:hypothetical protein [Rhizobium sp. PDO1-076]EHS51511.1 hypothetical protein PDO_1902 [Rhizobium sp. PDO1-076]